MSCYAHESQSISITGSGRFHFRMAARLPGANVARLRSTRRRGEGFEHAARVSEHRVKNRMGSAGQRDPRKYPRQLRAVAVAGENAVGPSRLRQGRARRLQRREGLFPDVSRILSGGQFVSAAGEGQRAVPGDLEPARTLGQRADGRHGGRQHRRPMHQLRQAGDDRVFLRHGRL